MNDPLDDLLTPSPAPPGEPLRRELLGRTTRALRWRRRRRHLAFAACVAGLFALCLVPPPEEPPAPPPRPVEVAAQPADVAPAVLEWRALDRPEDAAALYREAADRYLEAGDASDALRCYANAIDKGDTLDVTTDDSWLLIAIKHARKKELNP
jgi:hypothetical protein